MATPFRLKRSSVTGKRPALSDLQIGELALNFYDGHLFAERDTGGVGIGTTVALLTPWKENFGGGSIEYVGTVTATTYHGNQVIGTPAGGFKTGAFTINNTDHTKDSINELNFILGKLVPKAPDTFDSTVSIFVCNEPVADCKDTVACPNVVILVCSEAVVSPRVVILDCKDAVASPNTDTLLCKEPVSAFRAANWSATAPPPLIFIAPSTVNVEPSQTNLSPKLN